MRRRQDAWWKLANVARGWRRMRGEEILGRRWRPRRRRCCHGRGSSGRRRRRRRRQLACGRNVDGTRLCGRRRRRRSCGCRLCRRRRRRRRRRARRASRSRRWHHVPLLLHAYSGLGCPRRSRRLVRHVELAARLRADPATARASRRRRRCIPAANRSLCLPLSHSLALLLPLQLLGQSSCRWRARLRSRRQARMEARPRTRPSSNIAAAGRLPGRRCCCAARLWSAREERKSAEETPAAVGGDRQRCNGRQGGTVSAQFSRQKRYILF